MATPLTAEQQNLIDLLASREHCQQGRMIFESLGGVAAETVRVIKCINKVVAQKLDTSETEVATQFWHRLGIDLQRSAHRAFM